MKDLEIYYNDERITIDSIPVPQLCITCKKSIEGDEKCLLTRLDQLEELKRGEMFCCFAYEPSDPSIDKNHKYREMEEFLDKKYGKSKDARIDKECSRMGRMMDEGYEFRLKSTDDISKYMRSVDSRPVHDPNGLKLKISRKKQIGMCLDKMQSILQEELVGMLVDLADRAVQELGIVPDFSYMDISLAMEEDDRFELAYMQICALKGSDPVKLLAERDIEKSRKTFDNT
jgi:hypothetical protein